MEQARPGGEITSLWNKNFICVMIANFLFCFAHFSVNPLVASYMKLLGTSAQVTGLLTGMFFGISLLIRPFAGIATTKLDKRKLLFFVFTIGSIASLGYALFHSVGGFVVFRFLNGVQYSIAGSLLMTLASDNLPIENLASGMGIYGMGSAVGMAIAPMIGESLVRFGTGMRGSEDFGYTLMFLFAAVILVLAMVPGLLMSPNRRTKEEIASTGAWYKNIFTVHALPMTVILFLLMVPYSLFNNYMIEFGREQGINSISVFYIVLALTMAVSRPLSGVLADRFGTRRIMFPALALFAASFLIIGGSITLGTVILGAVVAAVGYGAAQPSIQAMCIQTETPLRYGVASNTIYIGIDLSMFLGPLLGSFVYDKYDYAVMYKSAAIPVCLSLAVFAALLPLHNRRVKALRNER